MGPRPGLAGIETEAQQLASLVARTLPVTVASVALWDEPSLVLTVKAVDTVRPLDRSLQVGVRVPLPGAAWHRIAFEPSAILLEYGGDRDLALEQEDELALIPNMRSMCLLPIRFAEETVGVLVLGEARAVAREHFSREKQQRCQAILAEFVMSTAPAWEALRLRRQVRAMSSMSRLISGVSAAGSFDDVLGSLLAEVTDWLGAPARGVLIGMTAQGVEVLAECRMPATSLDDGGRQLVLAMTRTMDPCTAPVSVVPVGGDALDPVATADPRASAWTRIALPLMQRDRVLGIACIYFEDTLRLGEWELEAFRRRGEIAALGIEMVRSAAAHEAEREWLRQMTAGFFASYRWTLVQEAFGVATRALPRVLPDRLRRAVPALAARPEAPPADDSTITSPDIDPAALVVEVVSEVLTGLWGSDDGADGLPSPPLDVNEAVRRALHIAKAAIDRMPGGPGAEVSFRFQPHPEPLPAAGAPILVGAIMHFIESAIATVPEGRAIHGRALREGGDAIVSVSFEGTEPDDETAAVPLLGDHANPRVELGFSVVHALAGRHGGDAALSRGTGGGVTLTIRLPLSPETPATVSRRGVAWRAPVATPVVEHLR